MTSVGVKKKKQNGKVLILGDDNRSFLTVIRSLGRHGLHIHVGWCPPDSSALHSRYIEKVHDIPPYSVNDNSWKHAFISILTREKFELVIPCNDQSLIPLQKHRDELNRFANIYLLDERSYEVVFNKLKTNELARSLGIRVPEEKVVSDPDEIETILTKFRLPVVLKPVSSFTENNLVDKNCVFKIYSEKELEKYLKNMLNKEEKVLVQENFIGTGVGVEVLVDHGELLLAFQHVRIHELIMGGRSSYRKSVPLDQELLEATIKLLKAVNCACVAMVEFKVNFETGDWVLIEINGRFWGSLPLAVASGADFPYYLYQMLKEGKRDFPREYKTGIYCRNLLYDINWFLENLRADKGDPSLATLPLWQVAKEIKNLLTFCERSDTFVLDDPLPGFVELAYILKKVITKQIKWKEKRKIQY